MKVLVVGCGGIGSYFAHHIDKLISLKQIKDCRFTFFDDDIIEKKNMLYQNFETSDIDSFKTIALEEKYYNINFENKRVDLADVCTTDLLILCADNNMIRRIAWTNWETNKIPFLDARANGKCFGIYSNITDNYMGTISSDNGSSSCQNPFQIAKLEIEYGNVIVAAMLAQAFLNYHRKKELISNLLINL